MTSRFTRHRMYDIAVTDLQNALEPDTERLRTVAWYVFQEEDVASARVSIALVDDKRIRELNRDYLNHDYETDVLSFLLNDEHDEGRDESTSNVDNNGRRIDGEVIISAETALRISAHYGWSPHDELVLYLVHGLLHLVGYDDLTHGEKQLMRSRERAILGQFDLNPHYAEDADADESDQPPSGHTGREVGS